MSKFNPGDKVRVKSVLPPASSWVSNDYSIAFWSMSIKDSLGEEREVERESGGLYRLLKHNDPNWVKWADESWLEPVNATSLQLQGGSATWISNPGSIVFKNFAWPSATDPQIEPVTTQPEPREYDGFCTPCGGFRKHRIGCPLKNFKLPRIV